MTTFDWSKGSRITPSELPVAITSYLSAHHVRDLDTAMSYYTADAVVVDEGNTYRGPDAIRAWLASSASEFTYTVEPRTATRVDDRHYDVLHHLEGDFPGGVVDLHFRISLRGALLERLVIEP